MQIIQDHNDGENLESSWLHFQSKLEYSQYYPRLPSKQFRVVYYKTYTGSSVSKSTVIDMPPTKEIRRRGRGVSWVITTDRIKEKILVKTLPSDQAFLEWGDVIIEIIRNQREQLMMRLLKENLEK